MKLTAPDGSFMFAPFTPSGSDTYRNVRAKLRRMGLRTQGGGFRGAHRGPARPSGAITGICAAEQGDAMGYSIEYDACGEPDRIGPIKAISHMFADGSWAVVSRALYRMMYGYRGLSMLVGEVADFAE